MDSPTRGPPPGGLAASLILSRSTDKAPALRLLQCAESACPRATLSGFLALLVRFLERCESVGVPAMRDGPEALAQLREWKERFQKYLPQEQR